MDFVFFIISGLKSELPEYYYNFSFYEIGLLIELPCLSGGAFLLSFEALALEDIPLHGLFSRCFRSNYAIRVL